MNSPYPSKKFIIDTDQAPRAIGPYSQAVGFAGLLFISGQIPVDPHSGEVSAGGVETQTRQVMKNLQQVLMGAGLDFSHVLKTTVYLRNMNDYDLVNEVYGLYFDHSPPARVCVEVSRLPKDVLVEIDAIAAAPTDYEARTGGVDEDEVEEETGASHPGPDDWEARHIEEAKATHADLTAKVDDEVEDTSSAASAGSPGEAVSDSSDSSAEQTPADTADTRESDDDANEESEPRPGFETQELTVDDLQQTQAPKPPPLSTSKLNIPRPKSPASDDE